MEKQIIALIQEVVKQNYNIELGDIKLAFPPKKNL
jgi:hypothetical protein